MKQRPAVALLIETSNAYARGLLRGVKSFLREHEEWSIYLPELGRGDSPSVWLKGWDGSGIIARIENERIAQAVRASNVSVVDVSAARLIPNAPWVETDDAAIARIAAEHLLERQFRNIAFCGENRFNWSQWRSDHFSQIIEEEGYDCHVYAGTSHKKRITWQQEQRALTKWVEQLPKPIGIFACYDIQAQQLLDVCRTLEINIPEEVAVLGVDNDELLCNFAEPTLTSIIPDAHKTGYRAAELLSQMMRGEDVSTDANLIKPLGIKTRESTDILAIDDPEIMQALQFIRCNACTGINVQDVLKTIPLSRRVFEKRFQKLVGRTPHAEILRRRLDRVKELLRETDLKLSSIAQRVGFVHVEYMSVAFKKATGVSPSVFRKDETIVG